MKRWFFIAATFILTARGQGTVAHAAALAVTVPGDTKFVLRLDLQAFRATALGSKLFDIARHRAQRELSGGGADGKGPDLDKIHEMLGFDPFTEIKAIIVSASSYERPEQSLVVSVEMGKSTGNLEGLILALPGYAAEEHGKYTIHSAAPEKDAHVFGAIHTGAQGNKTVLVAARRESVTRFLDQLDGKSVGDDSFKTIKLPGDGTSSLVLEVLKLPTEMIDDGPQANVVKVIQAVSLRIGESGGDVNVRVSLATKTELQAEQLRQIVQGLMAMIDFAQSANPEDDDLKNVQRLVRKVQAACEGSSLKVNLTIPAAELNKVIDEQLGDD